MSVRLHLRQKENTYLRVIAFSENPAEFQETYLNWDEWKYYTKEAESMRLEIGERISRGNPAPMLSLLPAIQTLLRDFLKKTTLHLPEGSLHLLWDTRESFFPLELLYPEQTTVHYVPVKSPASFDGTRYDPVLFLYDSRLNEAPAETASLAKIVSRTSSFECFSEEHMEEYRPSLAGAKVIHFSGHGYWEEKGSIGLGPGKSTEIPYSEGLSLAVLSCCEAGRAPAGIVENLLKKGTQAVLASPYTLPGDLSGCRLGMEDFYAALPELGASGAYAKASGESRDFGFFFRLYRGFSHRFYLSRPSHEA